MVRICKSFLRVAELLQTEFVSHLIPTFQIASKYCFSFSLILSLSRDLNATDDVKLLLSLFGEKNTEPRAISVQVFRLLQFVFINVSLIFKEQLG